MSDDAKVAGQDDGLFFLFLFIFGALITLYVVNKYHVFSWFWWHVRVHTFEVLAHLPRWFPFHTQIENGYQVLIHYQNSGISPQFRTEFDKRYSSVYSGMLALLCILAGGWGIVKQYKQHPAEFNAHSIAIWLSKRFLWIKTYIKDSPDKRDPRFRFPSDDPYMQAATPYQYATSVKTAHQQTILNKRNLTFDDAIARQLFNGQLNNGTRTKGKLTLITCKIEGRTYINFSAMLEQLSKIELELYNLLLPNILTVNVKPMLKGRKNNHNKTKWLALTQHEQVTMNLMRYHRYTRTFLMSLYEASWGTGVKNMTQFPWVLKTDRVLYLALSSTERNEGFVEAIGCFCHWMHEKKLAALDAKSYGIKTPETKVAIETLRHYVNQLSGKTVDVR